MLGSWHELRNQLMPQPFVTNAGEAALSALVSQLMSAAQRIMHMIVRGRNYIDEI